MKKLFFLGLVVVANLGFVISKSSATEKENIGGLTKGIKGTVNGIYVCHCPDDRLECYCGT